MPSPSDMPAPRAATPTVASGACYVLVFEGETTRLVHLPEQGETVVGSSEQAVIRLSSDVVRPEHLRISTRGNEAVLTALGEAAGARVNDEPLQGQHVLTSGDVIALGDVTLGFHRNATRVGARSALAAGPFHQRLEEEIERALRYRNSLALLVLDTGSASADVMHHALAEVCRVVRRVDIVGETARSEIAVLFPETGRSASIPAQRLLSGVLANAPGIRGGIAICPDDGCEPDTLLTGARLALRAGTPGEIASVSAAASFFEIGDRKVVSVDPMMKRLFGLLRQLATSTLPVLVQGETGSGKEIASRALHEWSPRCGKRLVSINCAALPESLLESELFGHERGAFSGAVGAKPGLFERASGGTIFLDEVGECSPMTQAKLLRVLETHRVSRVGGTEERPVDVRVVSATNRVLEEEIANGRFRQDLYYRLNAATVLVPPLRNRPLDIPVLAARFLDEACESLGRPRMSISAGAMQRLVMHSWPGNVRELKNVMDFVAASVPDTELAAVQLPDKVAATVAPWMVPRSAPARAASASTAQAAKEAPAAQPDAPRFRSIYEEIAELEKRRITEALEAAGGVRARAAELIQMPLRTFVTKLKVHGLTSFPQSAPANREAKG